MSSLEAIDKCLRYLRISDVNMMLVGQSYDEGWGACDRIRLRLAAGSAAAANHNSLTSMLKRGRVLWS
jgi:hypothetical protein